MPNDGEETRETRETNDNRNIVVTNMDGQVVGTIPSNQMRSSYTDILINGIATRATIAPTGRIVAERDDAVALGNMLHEDMERQREQEREQAQQERQAQRDRQAQLDQQEYWGLRQQREEEREEIRRRTRAPIELGRPRRVTTTSTPVQGNAVQGIANTNAISDLQRMFGNTPLDSPTNNTMPVDVNNNTVAPLVTPDVQPRIISPEMLQEFRRTSGAYIEGFASGMGLDFDGDISEIHNDMVERAFRAAEHLNSTPRYMISQLTTMMDNVSDNSHDRPEPETIEPQTTAAITNFLETEIGVEEARQLRVRDIRRNRQANDERDTNMDASIQGYMSRFAQDMLIRELRDPTNRATDLSRIPMEQPSTRYQNFDDPSVRERLSTVINGEWNFGRRYDAIGLMNRIARRNIIVRERAYRRPTDGPRLHISAPDAVTQFAIASVRERAAREDEAQQQLIDSFNMYPFADSSNAMATSRQMNYVRKLCARLNLEYDTVRLQCTSRHITWYVINDLRAIALEKGAIKPSMHDQDHQRKQEEKKVAWIERMRIAHEAEKHGMKYKAYKIHLEMEAAQRRRDEQRRMFQNAQSSMQSVGTYTTSMPWRQRRSGYQTWNDSIYGDIVWHNEVATEPMDEPANTTQTQQAVRVARTVFINETDEHNTVPPDWDPEVSVRNIETPVRGVEIRAEYMGDIVSDILSADVIANVTFADYNEMVDRGVRDARRQLWRRHRQRVIQQNAMPTVQPRPRAMLQPHQERQRQFIEQEVRRGMRRMQGLTHDDTTVNTMRNVIDNAIFSALQIPRESMQIEEDDRNDNDDPGDG